MCSKKLMRNPGESMALHPKFGVYICYMVTQYCEKWCFEPIDSLDSWGSLFPKPAPSPAGGEGEWRPRTKFRFEIDPNAQKLENR